MDSKKMIKKIIRPNLVLTIILLIPPLTFLGIILLLADVLPKFIRMSKSITALDNSGLLDQAAEELKSASAKRYMDGRVILTENFFFCKGTGIVLTYNDILWAYRQSAKKKFLFITVSVTDSLCLATKSFGPKIIASMGKDELNEISNVISEICLHNNSCLGGYSKDNAAMYRQLSSK